MGDLNRLITGQGIKKYPGNTHNSLVDGELRARAAAGDQPLATAPQMKSPVNVLLYYTGDSAIKPGSTVKLGNVLITPTDDESAPYSELRFRCSAFVSTDPGETPYAVTAGPIEANGVGHGIIPQAWWAKVYISDAAHTHANKPTAGTILQSGLFGLTILWKETGTGEKWAVVAMAGQGADTYRLIRGQSVGIQAGGTILIDNVVRLAGGLDPTLGNPAINVRVVNIFSQSYADNEWIDAIYNPGVSISPAADWETTKTSTGTHAYTLIMGTVSTGANAEDASFEMNGIELLAGSLDPRGTPGSPTEVISIAKTTTEVIPAGYIVIAVYSYDNTRWELFHVERYRAIRGTWYSGASTPILMDHIVVLENGLDPRTDQTSSTETVSVVVVNGDTFTTGDKVWADFNAKDGVWESRPKASASAALFYGHITTAAGPCTSFGTPTTDGRCTKEDGTTGVILLNHYPDTAPVGAVVLFAQGGGIVTWSCGTL